MGGGGMDGGPENLTCSLYLIHYSSRCYLAVESETTCGE